MKIMHVSSNFFLFVLIYYLITKLSGSQNFVVYFSEEKWYLATSNMVTINS